jgi:hypothetical protein
MNNCVEMEIIDNCIEQMLKSNSNTFMYDFKAEQGQEVTIDQFKAALPITEKLMIAALKGQNK